jgi:hypothetical protein
MMRDVRFACRSHNAEFRMSASLILLFELEYMKTLHCVGWNSAAVMTSVSSSMLAGLISTMSVSNVRNRRNRRKKKRTETLITDVQIPEVDAQVICGNVCLLIGINGDRMDMVGMSVGVNFARYGGDNVVLMLHTG